MKIVIGLSGYQKAGKSTIAKHLSCILNIPVIPLALPLKRICYEYLNVFMTKDAEKFKNIAQKSNLESFFDFIEKNLNSPLEYEKIELLMNLLEKYHKINSEIEKDNFARKILQYVGTEIFRNKNENFWINEHKKITGDISCIVDDIRFPNELEYIVKERNGINFYLIRKDINQLDNHESEKYHEYLKQNSVIIYNDNIFRTLEKILVTIKERKVTK